MADLDYAKVTGRFSLTAGDTDVDVDVDPDTIWCDSGTVFITPITTYTKVVGGTPVPFTAGHSVIECTIDSEGYLTYRGQRFVKVIDLTSPKVNPQIGEGLATHKVTFRDVFADGTPVSFPGGPVRLTEAGLDGDGENDLTKVLPVATGSATPITRGEQGTSIESLAVEGGELVVTLDDGSELNAGALPVGPGGSDPGVASYLGNDASATAAAARELLAADIPDAGTLVGGVLSNTIGEAIDPLAVEAVDAYLPTALDPAIVALDADDTSDLRVQQDARHVVKIGEVAAEGIADTEYTPGMTLDQATVIRLVGTLAARSGIVMLESHPRQGAEATDDARLDRAVADMVTRGAKTLMCGAATYTLTTQHNLTMNNMVVQGVGRATVLSVTANVTALNFTASYVSLQDLEVYTPTTGRTVFPVIFANCNMPAARRVRFEGITDSRFSGAYFKDDPAVSPRSIGGTVESSVFSHACVRIEPSDVIIQHTYVWAMTCDYAIGVFNGAGNGFLDSVSIVPPLKTTTTGIAGVYFDSASGYAGTWNGSILIDGNPSLSVRQGIYIGPNWFNIDLTVKANKCDSDVVVIDSAYCINIDYHGENNNTLGDGSVDIRVKQTGAQPVEKVRITGQCLQTAAVVGTAGPAVKVESSVTDANAVRVEVDVKQPSGGGGYSNPEIDVPVSGGYPTQRLGASRGQLSAYRVVGSVACIAGDTGKTITLGSPRPMAYRPRPSQITLVMESAGQTLPAYRMTYTTDNQIYVAFASALTAAGTLHWRAHLD